MQRDLIVSAGLGNISGSALKTTLLPIGKLTPELRLGNLIFVGNISSFPVLTQISKFPLLSNNGQFNITDGSPDDGVIEMINSPWSPFRVVMLVSGNNDAATIKASQAVSSGVIIPGKQKNLSLVQTVQTKPVPVSVPVDQTLGELGYTRERLSGFGVNSVSYIFYIPPGQTATSDAHFELLFGHSALIDFERSGLVVTINNQPIGSVRLTQETAAESINIVQFSIPPSVLIPGNNRVDIIATLQPFSNCNPPDFSALWLNIWPESNLHLPLTTPQINLLSALDLSKYPAPYVFNPVLGNTAFVLQKNLPETWNNAAQIAAYLGDKVNGPISAFKVFFDGEIPEAELSVNNFIAVGHSSELSLVGQLKDNLPAPFEDHSDNIVERNMQVIFRLSPNTSVGYVEFLQSPWSSDAVIILALGNNLEGISWATSALIDTPLGSRLAGDFAVINDGERITTTDTRITPYVAEAIPTAGVPGAQANSQTVTPPITTTAPPVVERPVWVLWVLILSIIAVFVVLSFVIVNSWKQNRVGGSTVARGMDMHSLMEFVKQIFSRPEGKLDDSNEDKSKGKKDVN
ncbi:MAG: cellulose biosynthesis cyclic di-GMP-binding regulatory protein BcsB [Anaerolineales bacterium]